ncbi:hypothetical protein MiSe_85500 [Microseira wollei NIES-4236]|uniref:Uncharacterized protein n=1 Tax=Microseira wollei NIES-4236 TaxID=2530354 RepID=A0AAV3XR92_9CYAN|nr:hypothetical protein MiSe_85500 [Microseira wollei NIES-4236]
MIINIKIRRWRPFVVGAWAPRVLGMRQGWDGSPVVRRGAQMRAPTAQGNQKFGNKGFRLLRTDWLSDRAI